MQKGLSEATIVYHHEVSGSQTIKVTSLWTCRPQLLSALPCGHYKKLWSSFPPINEMQRILKSLNKRSLLAKSYITLPPHQFKTVALEKIHALFNMYDKIVIEVTTFLSHSRIIILTLEIFTLKLTTSD